MFTILLTVSAIVFIFGLVQWARGGAVLWDISRLKRTPRDKSERTAVKNKQKLIDSLLQSSFKTIGFLALAMWLLLSVVMILDKLDIDIWNSFKLHGIYGAPNVRATKITDNAGKRGLVIKSLGEGLRKK